jgi:hypothetical protein
MVYPTISTSLTAIFNVRCEMDPSKVKSINAVLSNSNLIEMSSDFDRCLVVFGGGNYC